MKIFFTIFLSMASFAETISDEEIIKNLDFIQNIEMVKNVEIAKQLIIENVKQDKVIKTVEHAEKAESAQ